MTHPPGNVAIGSPDTGLCGPFLFPLGGAFAPGFAPFDRLFTGFLPPGGRHLGALWLLDADEPLPAAQDRKGFHAA